ncbi:hypothetical protein I79_010117 [Cricetulus griseus]|uniref:Uncharacterized protein n=1 Tax=Cricetulus griseus TaxID=10029 RepID=G3HHL4_CRIGR|nr:hypothetical protein I79_010117 [Cricetulus griseus]
MAQQLEAHTILQEDPSSVPSTLVWKSTNHKASSTGVTLFWIPWKPAFTYVQMHVCTRTHKFIKNNINLRKHTFR